MYYSFLPPSIFLIDWLFVLFHFASFYFFNRLVVCIIFYCYLLIKCFFCKLACLLRRLIILYIILSIWSCFFFILLHHGSPVPSEEHNGFSLYCRCFLLCHCGDFSGLHYPPAKYTPLVDSCVDRNVDERAVEN